jgi:YegS/Rv2252/BmrU family lipid kinase
VPLGVVPLGTGNVWARELGLPLDPGRAIVAQLANRPRAIDVGCVNGRPFLSIASAGFDAEIVRQVESTSKALGQLAYPITALQMASALHATPARVWIDSEPVRQMQLLAGIVMNAHLYAGILPLGSRSQLDDGRLELVLFTGGPLELAGQIASLLAGHQPEDAQAFVRHVTRVRIEAISTPMPVQADGEAVGTTPFHVEIMPQSLFVLLDDGVVRSPGYVELRSGSSAK